MTGYELHDLLANNRELISDTWNFFLSVHLAIFGIVYIASGRITRLERFSIVIAYIAFMYMNYSAQVDNYDVYDRIIEQIKLTSQGDGGDVARALVDLNPQWVADWLRELYAVAAGVSTLVIMLINRADS